MLLKLAQIRILRILSIALIIGIFIIPSVPLFRIYSPVSASTVVVFTTTPGGGTWEVPAGVFSVEVLVVAGGGGGGQRFGGGGGGGGVIYNASKAVTPGAFLTVTVGDGGAGAGGNSNGNYGDNGQDSVFDDLTAIGGGTGGYFSSGGGFPTGGKSGGSGGGGSFFSGQDNDYFYGYGTSGQGNDGGVGDAAAGGGGGAFEAGFSSSDVNVGGGGEGYTSSISGSSEVYGSGGGGSGNVTGGDAGHNAGNGSGSTQNGSDAVTNYGGGGGGARNIADTGTVTGGDGGSGIVIISYVSNTPSVTTLAATIGDVGNGGVSAINDTAITHRGFVWGDTTEADPGDVAPALAGYAYNWVQTGTYGIGNFNHVLTGYVATTTVYFRACAKNTTGHWGYGAEESFTTSISTVDPSIITGSAIGTTSNSTTLQGSVIDMGSYATLSVFFEYGTSSSYGNVTTPQAITAIGAISSPLTGLLPNTTYHFRIVATYTYGSTNGNDNTFATLTTDGGSTTISITNGTVKAFTGYLETGDWLFVAECVNTYIPYYPKSDITRYFQLQLLDPTGTTILAANTLRAWGDQPISIYLNKNNATALSITEGSAYIIRMVGTFATPPSEDYTLTPSDWEGTDLTALDSWVIQNVALNMSIYGLINKNTNTSNMIQSETDSPMGAVLTDVGGGYFTLGIPALSNVRPDIFLSSKSKPAFTVGTTNNVYDNTTWVSGTSYVIGNKVGYSGIVYICISPISSAVNPVTDAGAHWQVSSLTYSWQPNATYAMGNIRAYGGKLYTCSAAIVSDVPPPNDTAHWSLASASWVSGAAYVLNDKVTYNNVAYNCILGFGGSATSPPNDITHWVEIVGGVWEAQVGNKLANDANFFGSILGIRGNNFSGVMLGCLVFILAFVGIMAGGKALPLLILSFPILLWGNQMRVIGIEWTVIICIAMVFMFAIKYFVSRT